MHTDATLAVLERQNRLLRIGISLGLAISGATLLMSVDGGSKKQVFEELDVKKINIMSEDGKLAAVIAGRGHLPREESEGKLAGAGRTTPGFVFYNEAGQENGRFTFNGKLGTDGKPVAGLEFQMDRLGGGHQLVLSQQESLGTMTAGLAVNDTGASDSQETIERLFIGKTRERASAVMLSDAKGQVRIKMLVSIENGPELQFLNKKGEVIQRLPKTKVRTP
jgi:hypothetical protein